MIPFICPKDHVILNLNQIVRLIEHPGTSALASAAGKPFVEILLATGETIELDGQAAEIVKSELMFSLQHYNAIKAAIVQQRAAAESNIVVPTVQ